MEDIRKITAQNQKAWDEIAEVRHAQAKNAAFFAAGGVTLDPRIAQAAGDIRGLRLLHLMCSTGEDTLSWAVLGAQATGVDISPRQIEIARRSAAEAGLPVQFLSADVYALPAELAQGTFDLVFMSMGVIVWLPELTRWARTIAAALRPNGRFLLFEEHPLAGILSVENGQLIIDGDYFGRGKPIVETGWTHFRGGEKARETKMEFAWPLGDVITALAQAGLVIERLEEYPSSQAWRFGDQLGTVQGLPGEYLLTARKVLPG